MKKEEITLKNTKAEILEALNNALEREKELSSLKSNPEKENKEKKIEKAISESKKNVNENIFSDELNNKFKNLEIAIEAEEEKLKNLYGVEKELNNLTLVVNAGKDVIAKIENDKKIKSDEYELKMKKLEEEYKEKTNSLSKEYESLSNNLKKEREREEEEYNYSIKREREISTNKWNDEKTTREKDLASKEEKAKLLLKDAEEKTKYIEELEKKVENITALIEKECDKCKKETTDILNKENDYKTELLSKDFQNNIDRLNDKVTSLNEELKKECDLNKELQSKLDQAYLQIKDMATKTVEASGAVKIISNNQNDKISN